ncbi:MAG: class D beta-lactamase [Woeseiaceae bacterium]
MRTTIVPFLFWLAVVTIGQAAHGRDSTQNETLDSVFEENGVVATIVVASADSDQVYIHNRDRSKLQFSPASTFKIPNTLIALDAMVVTSAETTFAWDGVERGVAAWNRNQTLQSAFRFSCVWCYQEIARSVGIERYADALAAVAYGNQQLGKHVDQFWLNGDLQISAIEQIGFLRKLLDYSIPFQRQYVDILKSIMLVEQSSDYTLYAKTGWTGVELHVGWYVGYIEKGEDTWLFAMNMRMDSAKQASLRKDLTIQSLRALEII